MYKKSLFPFILNQTFTQIKTPFLVWLSLLDYINDTEFPEANYSHFTICFKNRLYTHVSLLKARCTVFKISYIRLTFPSINLFKLITYKCMLTNSALFDHLHILCIITYMYMVFSFFLISATCFEMSFVKYGALKPDT